MLINAVKDVATALGDLIQATKAASGKNINDPSMNELKDSAKVSNFNLMGINTYYKDVNDHIILFLGYGYKCDITFENC